MQGLPKCHYNSIKSLCPLKSIVIKHTYLHSWMKKDLLIRENGKQCMMQMPVKTTLRLYCDDSRLVFKCIQRHQCIATQLPCYYSFVHKNDIVKLREIGMETGSTSSATKVIARYTRERGSPEANSGLSTSNLLLSYLILLDIYFIFPVRCSVLHHKDPIRDKELWSLMLSLPRLPDWA